jgi:hypothetical protein
MIDSGLGDDETRLAWTNLAPFNFQATYHAVHPPSTANADRSRKQTNHWQEKPEPLKILLGGHARKGRAVLVSLVK